MRRAANLCARRGAALQQGAMRRAAPSAPVVGVAETVSAAPALAPVAAAAFSQRRHCSAPRTNPKLRNVGVIAHVDHGKTTLVDALLTQSGAVKEDASASRVMDSNDLEKERGITILAKNTCIQLPEHTINIVDTPGHSDFAGEVERALAMLEGFILLVDAHEGPKPGTRYVLKKALESNLKPIVVLNKVDRTTQDKIEDTLDKIEMLFLELAANDDQLDYPVLYGSGKMGYMGTDPTIRAGTLQPLFDAIIEHVPVPQERMADHLQASVTSIEVRGKGKKFLTLRIFSGSLAVKDEVFVSDCHAGNELFGLKIQALSNFQGLERIPTEKAGLGDIVVLSGDNIDKLDIKVGNTLCLKGKPAPVPYLPLDPPSFMVNIYPNTSPVAGSDGTKFGGPEIRQRLVEESVRNLAMQLDIVGPGEFIVKGRGLMHLGVLFEEMRRQGFEMELGKPSVVYTEINGQKHEPWDKLTIRCESENADALATLLFSGHGEQISSDEVEGWNESVWHVPGRCMIGLAGKLRGGGGSSMEMSQDLLEYRPFNPEISLRRDAGSLLGSGPGEVTLDGLTSIAKHGVAFVAQNQKTYMDQIVGARTGGVGDLAINITKATNTWSTAKNSAGASQTHTLETALEYIQDDELVEVTPLFIRMRKRNRTDKERKAGLKN